MTGHPNKYILEGIFGGRRTLRQCAQIQINGSEDIGMI
jgi:hypothetical protein